MCLACDVCSKEAAHLFLFLRDALIAFPCTYILLSSSLVGLPAFWFGASSGRKVSARIISKPEDDDEELHHV